jgi:hypothetical protein
VTEIAQENGTVVGQVQTDTFCPGCGYNLHTRPVTRDERLGILVCRCPECGRFSAAGQTTTAARPWLNRLATMLLTGWVFFLLLLFALCSLFLGMLAYGHTMEMVGYRQTNVPRLVNGRMVYTGYGYYQLRYEIRHIPREDVDGQARHEWAQGWLTFFAVLLGLIAGLLFGSLLWHCRGWRRLLGFLPPAVGCAVAAILWIGNPATIEIRDWGLMQIGELFVIELIAVGVGLLTGRRFARGLVRVFVPPKARQHLAFLWIADGKILKPD